MAELTEKSHPLARVYEQLKELASYGDNSVFRRVLTVVEAEMGLAGLWNEADGTESTCRPDCRNFSFLDAQAEVVADDRRKSVLLDPEEAYIAHLIDLYSGRLTVLEARDQYSQYDTDALRMRALETMRGRHPIVSVNLQLAESVGEAASILRRMAELLESHEWSAFQAEALNSHPRDTIAPLTLEQCHLVATENLGSRWLSNPRRLQYHYRDKHDCVSRDVCCRNQTHRIVYQNDRWKTVWTDTGSENNPPPQAPPDFQRQPWNNRLHVFEDPGVGTLTSEWGWRNLEGVRDFHGGIDIAVPPGTRVRNVAAGEVVGFTTGDERGVVLRVGNQTHSYLHIDRSADLRREQQIPAGTYLGTVAQRNGPHLHYAIHEPPNGNWIHRNDGNSRNPLP
jgi:peptidase M23-like protein